MKPNIKDVSIFKGGEAGQSQQIKAAAASPSDVKSKELDINALAQKMKSKGYMQNLDTGVPGNHEQYGKLNTIKLAQNMQSQGYMKRLKVPTVQKVQEDKLKASGIEDLRLGFQGFSKNTVDYFDAKYSNSMPQYPKTERNPIGTPKQESDALKDVEARLQEAKNWQSKISETVKYFNNNADYFDGEYLSDILEELRVYSQAADAYVDALSQSRTQSKDRATQSVLQMRPTAAVTRESESGDAFIRPQKTTAQKTAEKDFYAGNAPVGVLRADIENAQKTIYNINKQIDDLNKKIEEAEAQIKWNEDRGFTVPAEEWRQLLQTYQTAKASLENERAWTSEQQQKNERTEGYYWSAAFAAKQGDPEVKSKIADGKKKYKEEQDAVSNETEDAKYATFTKSFANMDEYEKWKADGFAGGNETKEVWSMFAAAKPEVQSDGSVLLTVKEYDPDAAMLAEFSTEYRRNHPIAVSLDHMTDAEKDNFYYMIGAGYDEMAAAYAQQTAFEARRGRLKEIEDWAGKNLGTEILATLQYGTMLPAAGLDFLGSRREYAESGLRASQNIGPGAVRDALSGGVAKNLNEWSGTFKENRPVIGGKGAGDLYQLGLSMGESYGSAMAFGKYATIFLGLSAASSAYNDAIDRGASVEKAQTVGALSGISEALFEYASIDKFLNGKSAGKWIVDALVQGGVEGSEELLTSAANRITDNHVMGLLSNRNLAIEEYMKNGMSHEAAAGKATKEFYNQLAYDFFGGFVSGGVMGGAQSATKYARANAFVDTIMSKPDSKAYEMVAKAANVNGSETEQEASQKIKKWYLNDENASKVASEAVKIYSDEISKDIKNISEEAKAVTTQQQETQRQTEIRAEQVHQNNPDSTVIASVGTQAYLDLGADLKTAQAAGSVLDGIVAGTISSDNMSNSQAAALQLDTQRGVDAVKNVLGVEVNRAVTKSEARSLAKSVARSYEETAENAVATQEFKAQQEPQDIEEQGDVYDTPSAQSQEMAQNASSAETAEQPLAQEPIADVNGERGDELNQEYVDEYEGYSEESSAPAVSFTQFSEEYRKTHKKASAQDVYLAYQELIEKSKASHDTSNEVGLVRNEYSDQVSKEIADAVDSLGKLFNLSIRFADLSAQNDNGRYILGTNEVLLDVDPRKAGAKNAFLFTVSHEIGHAAKERLTAEQWASFEKVAIKAMGGETIVKAKQAEDAAYRDESIAREDVACDFIGKLLSDKQMLDEFCVTIKTGKISTQTAKGLIGAIRKVLGMFRGKGIKQFDAAMKRLSERAASQFGTDLETAEAAVSQMQKAFAEAINVKQTVEEKAAKDAVIQASSEYRSAVKENTISHEISEAIGKDGIALTNENGDVAVVAKETRNGVDDVIVDPTYWDSRSSKRTWLDKILTDEAGNAVSGKDLFVALMKENGYSQNDIDRAVKRMDDLLEKLESDFAAFGKLSKNLEKGITTNILNDSQRVLYSLVSNGDYAVNGELSTTCVNRQAFQDVYEHLLADGVMKDIVFNSAAIAQMNEILRKHGYLTACFSCFVESRRVRVQNWAKAFVSKWNEAALAHGATTTFNFFGSRENVESLKTEDLFEIEEQINTVDKNDVGNVKLGQGNMLKKINELMDKVPALAKQLTVEDIMSVKGLAAMRQYGEGGRNILALLRSSYGAASPKLSQEFEAYGGDFAKLSFDYIGDVTGKNIKGASDIIKRIANRRTDEVFKGQKPMPKTRAEEYKRQLNSAATKREALVEYLYQIAGIRYQSFSDFDITQVFDKMQLFNDVAALRAPLHEYTKVVADIRIFGMTGGKMNASVIHQVDPSLGKENAGLVRLANGELGYVADDRRHYEESGKDKANRATQSIDYLDAVALMLDPRYAANVGTIAIGFSEKHIRMMLNDENIRMVIPYHRSGLPALYMHLTGLAQVNEKGKLELIVNDFTNEQTAEAKAIYDKNGKEVSGNKLTQDDKKAIKAIANSWKFSEHLRENGYDAKKTADEYLKWCNSEHTYTKNGETYTFKVRAIFEAFSDEANYYKTLIDFDPYNTVTKDIAPQQAVGLHYAGDGTSLGEGLTTTLSDAQIAEYRQRLEDTGLFTSEQVDGYVAWAKQSLFDMIREEMSKEQEYIERTDKEAPAAYKEVKEMLLSDFRVGEYSEEAEMKKLGIKKEKKTEATKINEKTVLHEADLTRRSKKDAFEAESKAYGEHYGEDIQTEAQMERAKKSDEARAAIRSDEASGKNIEQAKSVSEAIGEATKENAKPRVIPSKTAADTKKTKADAERKKTATDASHKAVAADASRRLASDMVNAAAEAVKEAEKAEQRARKLKDHYDSKIAELKEQNSHIKKQASLEKTFRLEAEKESRRLDRKIAALEQQRNRLIRAMQVDAFMKVEGNKQAVRAIVNWRKNGLLPGNDLLDITEVETEILSLQEQAKIAKGEVPKGLKGKDAEIKKAITEVRNLLAYEFVSDVLPFEEMGRLQSRLDSVETKVTAYKNRGAMVNAILTESLRSPDGERIDSRSLQDVLGCWKNDKVGGKIDEGRQQLLDQYLYLRHNTDRMSAVQNARKNLLEFLEKHPEYKSYAIDVVRPDGTVYQKSLDASARSIAEAAANGDQVAAEYIALATEFANAKNKPVFGTKDGAKALSADASKVIADEMAAKNPWLEDKASEFYAWWDKFMQAWWVGTQGTQEQYDAMKKLYPHYVPTYRAFKGGIVNWAQTQYGIGSRNAVREAKGSTLDLNTVGDNVSTQIQNVVNGCLMDRIFENVYEELLEGNVGFGEYAAINVRKDEKVLALLYEDAYTPDPAKTFDEITRESKDGKTLTWSGYFNGEMRELVVSKRLFDSLKALAGGDKIINNVTAAGNFVTTPMKTAITGINPTFALRNVPRDFTTALVNSVAGLGYVKYYGQAIAKMTGKADLAAKMVGWITKLRDTSTGEESKRGIIRQMAEALDSAVLKSSQEWADFVALGGTQSTYARSETGFLLNRSVRGKIADAKNSVLSKLGSLNEATESVARFAEYLATIDMFGDTVEGRAKAIRNAAEVTVDFSRHGRIGKMINAWAPYWNPGIQGISKLYRSIRFPGEAANITDPKKKSLKAAAALARGIGLVGVFPRILQFMLIALAGAEDEWDALSDRVKDTYFLIPLKKDGKPTGKFIKVPYNRDWGSLAGATFSRIVQGARGREDAWKDFWQSAIWANFSIKPELIGYSQISDIHKNEDFAGRAIVPYAIEEGKVARESAYTEDTSWIGKMLAKTKIAEAIGLNPIEIDFLISSYFGDFGDMFIELTDADGINGVKGLLRDVLLGSFTADSAYSSLSSSRYYDMIDSLETAVGTARYHDKENYQELPEHQILKAINASYGDQINDLNKQIREEKDEDMKRALKYEVQELMKEALSFYEKCISGEVQNPVLYKEYEPYGSEIQQELIRLDKFTGDEYDYVFTPNSSAPKIGKHENTDAEKDYFKSVYEQNYSEWVGKVMSSEQYAKASDEQKVAYIEEARALAYYYSKKTFALKYGLSSEGYDPKKEENTYDNLMDAGFSFFDAYTIEQKYKEIRDSKEYKNAVIRSTKYAEWISLQHWNATKENAARAAYKYSQTQVQDPEKYDALTGKYKMSPEKAVSVVMEISGMDYKDGERNAKIAAMGNLTDSERYDAILSYYDSPNDAKTREKIVKARDAGIPADVYVRCWNEIGKLEGDKDSKGNTIDNSRKNKVAKYLRNASGLTSKQKNLIWSFYYSKGYADGWRYKY